MDHETSTDNSFLFRCNVGSGPGRPERTGRRIRSALPYLSFLAPATPAPRSRTARHAAETDAGK